MEAIQNLPEVAKKDFPLLENNCKSNNKIIYLDHAATTQKPIQVLNKMKLEFRVQILMLLDQIILLQLFQLI